MLELVAHMLNIPHPEGLDAMFWGYIQNYWLAFRSLLWRFG